MRALRSLREWFQFLHAWLLSRALVVTCGCAHGVDDNSVLVVAPHPDDETLGCGGLIASKRALRANVTIVFLTDGSAGTRKPGAAEDDLRERRRAEAIAAAEQLGVPRSQLHFCDHPDGGLKNFHGEDREKIVEHLKSLIEQTNARAVYAPHRCDGHPDHQTAYELAECAAACADGGVKLYQYAIWMWWSQPLGMRLRWKDVARRSFHRVDAMLARKHRALRCHASQLSRFPLGFLRALPFEIEIFFEAASRNDGSEPRRCEA